MKTIPLSLIVLLFFSSIAQAQAPKLSDTDRVRIAEAFRLADAIGNRVWPKWDKAPFAVLLIAGEHEFLIRHPRPSDDFTLIGEDELLGSKVWFRKRKYNPQFLATFPAVGGVPTIVIGQAEATQAKASTHWVITMLHEHFHQLQYSQPRYYAEVDSLGLAGEDKTGMWMLNYDFPYTKPEVRDQFVVMCQLLTEALDAREDDDFAKKVSAYLAAKKKFRTLLKPNDYKYLVFQLWQEGIARYTEYKLAVLAAAEYEPSKEFQKLKDYIPFKEEARTVLAGIKKELTMPLDKMKRVAFYAFGAAEGLVLDRANPQWRDRYFEEKFSLDKHFREGR